MLCPHAYLALLDQGGIHTEYVKKNLSSDERLSYSGGKAFPFYSDVLKITYWSRIPSAAKAWPGSRGRPLTANSIIQPTKSWLSTCPFLWSIGSRDLIPPMVTLFGCTSRVLEGGKRPKGTTMAANSKNTIQAISVLFVCLFTYN